METSDAFIDGTKLPPFASLSVLCVSVKPSIALIRFVWQKLQGCKIGI